MNIKNTLKISCMGLSLMGLMACSGNKDQQTDSASAESIQVMTTAEPDSTLVDTPKADETPAAEEQVADTSEADIALIKDFYKKCVFGGAPSKSTLQKYCTASCMKKLAAANEYDDGGYAVWKFRSEAQDGDGPSKVNSVEATGDGWYKVSYTDMGAKGTKSVQIVDGKINNYR